MSMTNNTPRVPEWTIGDRLRKAREACGLDTAELSAVMETSRATIYNYENGTTTHLKPYIVKAWALATGVPVDWLMHGDEPSSGPRPTGGEPRTTREQQKRSTEWYARTPAPVVELARAA